MKEREKERQVKKTDGSERERERRRYIGDI